jgi:tetratricopeptide (TPR) repeat protein
LRAWIETEHPSWEQIVGKYVEAARGLEAAHEADVIHRDFKPDNIMLSSDGSVRVVDFGLAREDVPPDVLQDSEIDVEGALTRTGALVGTPAYMAPEQFEGGTIDARTDQFSLCVGLWEALYGERPFPGKTVAAVRQAVLGGARPRPRDDAGIPRFVGHALTRGLARRPIERWQSIRSLCEALVRPPRRLRKRIMVPALGLGLAAAVWGAGHIDHEQARAQCTDAAAAKAAEMWSDRDRASVRDGMLGTGVSYAESTVDATLPLLDAYGEAWRDTDEQACLATELDGSWSQGDRERASWCLDQRSQAFRALIDQLERGALIDDAVRVASRLPPIDNCGDQALLQRLPPPPAEADRAALAAVRHELAEVDVLGWMPDQHPRALQLAFDAAKRAGSLGAPAVRAHALNLAGELQLELARYEDAENTLEDAYFAALRAHDYYVAWWVCSDMVELVGDRLGRPGEGHRWARLGQVALEELGLDQHPLQRSRQLSDEARLLGVEGRYDEAIELKQQALALTEQRLGADHPNLAYILHNLGNELGRVGRYTEALAMFDRALRLDETTFGPDHPSLATLLSSYAQTHAHLGHNEEAEAMFQRATTLLETHRGPDHPYLAYTLNDHATLLSSMGQHERALQLHERALRIKEATLGPRHRFVASSLSNMAVDHHAMGNSVHATELGRRALEITEEAFGAEHPRVVLALVNLTAYQHAAGEATQARATAERALALATRHDFVAGTDPEGWFEFAKVVYDLDVDRPRAVAEAQRAADALREAGAGQADALAEVERWLAEHRDEAP